MLMRMWRNWKPHVVLVRIQNCAATVMIPQKRYTYNCQMTATLLLGMYPNNCSQDSNKDLYPSVHRTIVHSSQKAEKTHVPIKRWMGKQNVT